MTCFIEIATKPLLKLVFPQETEYFCTSHCGAGKGQTGTHTMGLSTMPALWRALARTDVKMVLCESTTFAPWSPRWTSRAVFDRRIFKGHCPLFRLWGAQLLRLRLNAPLAIFDHDDLPSINRHNIPLLRRACVYFKRELPVDHWRMFLKTAHLNLPSIRFRRKSQLRHCMNKFRPLSLGLPYGYVNDEAHAQTPKSVDIFFAGQTEHTSTHRRVAIEELKRLASVGVSVDISEQRLAPEEFRCRMARATLTWSPEGLGYDCFRHYESLACGSVPVINYPSIMRHQPLVDDQHAIYYAPEPGQLTRRVLGALADRRKLAQMARDGRAHVMQHHTLDAIARYVVNETLTTASATTNTESEANSSRRLAA